MDWDTSRHRAIPTLSHAFVGVSVNFRVHSSNFLIILRVNLNVGHIYTDPSPIIPVPSPSEVVIESRQNSCGQVVSTT